MLFLFSSLLLLSRPISQPPAVRLSWEEYYSSPLNFTLAEHYDATAETLSAIGNYYLKNVVASKLTNRLIYLRISDPVDLLVEDCFFSHCTATSMQLSPGVVIYVRLPGKVGNIWVVRTCVHMCATNFGGTPGTFLYSQGQACSQVNLTSLLKAPGPGQAAMNALGMQAEYVYVDNLNMSRCDSVNVAGMPLVNGRFSYQNFDSANCPNEKTIDRVFLIQKANTLFTNFINNTILNSKGSVFALQRGEESVVSSCVFINNRTPFVAVCLDSTMTLLITDSYIDSGKLSFAVWTNRIDHEITLDFTFLNSFACVIPPKEIKPTSEPPEPLMATIAQRTAQVIEDVGETLKITTIAATSVAGLGLSAIIIWIGKKLMKKAIKKGLNDQFNDSEEEEGKEEEDVPEIPSEKETNSMIDSSSQSFRASDERETSPRSKESGPINETAKHESVPFEEEQTPSDNITVSESTN